MITERLGVEDSIRRRRSISRYSGVRRERDCPARSDGLLSVDDVTGACSFCGCTDVSLVTVPVKAVVRLFLCTPRAGPVLRGPLISTASGTTSSSTPRSLATSSSSISSSSKAYKFLAYVSLVEDVNFMSYLRGICANCDRTRGSSIGIGHAGDSGRISSIG